METSRVIGWFSRVFGLAAKHPNLSVLAFYSAWSIVATYPLTLAPANHIENWGDPLLNVWIPAWDIHQLGHDPLHLFDAPIFYPAHNALALSELLLAQAVEALPIVALTGNWVLAYNIVVFSTFILCGFAAYRLARERLPAGASLVVGSAYAYSFFRVGEYSHIQILSAQWIPFALLALLRLWKRVRWRDGLLLAAAVILQLLSSFYLGLFLLVAIVFALLYLVVAERRLPDPRFTLRLVAAAALTLAVVLPFTLPYFQVEREFGLTRSIGDATGGSAVPRNYLAVPPTSLLYGTQRLPVLEHFQTDETLFPGFIPLVLALLGLVTIGRQQRGAFFLGLALVGILFSLGPTFRPGSTDDGLPLPYRLLYLYVPGFHSIRVVGRMGALATLGIAGLAGLGVSSLATHLPERWGATFGLVLATLVGAETLSIPTRMTPVETPAEVPAVYRWLAAQRDNAPALELPTIESRWLDRGADLERQGHEQYLSIYHWHPTPSGYSGFEPPLFWSVIRNAKDFPNDESVNFLQCVGVKYVVFHQNQYTPDRWQQTAGRIDAAGTVLKQLTRFGDDLVYQLAAAVPIDVAPRPAIILPSAVFAGSDYRGFLAWQNDGPPASLRSQSTIGIHYRWEGDAGQMENDATVPQPTCLARGWTQQAVDLATPRRPGQYRLTVSSGSISSEATVTVVPASLDPIPDDPRPALQLLDGPVLTPVVGPGGVVDVRTTWRLRHRTQDNFLLRLEIADGRGQAVASSTVDPFDGALETGRWLADEKVTVGLCAILPNTATSGVYTARVLVRYADGAPWKMAGPDNNDHDSIDLGTVTVR